MYDMQYVCAVCMYVKCTYVWCAACVHVQYECAEDMYVNYECNSKSAVWTYVQYEYMCSTGCMYSMCSMHEYSVCMGSMYTPYGQCVHTNTHIHTHANTCMGKYTHKHTRSRARAHTHTLTLSHTHNHTHTLTQLRFDQVLLYARLFTIDDSEVGLRLLGCRV